MGRGKNIKIEQLDFETGESIEIYASATKAADDNYISYISLLKRLERGKGTAVYNDKKLKFKRAELPSLF